MSGSDSFEPEGLRVPDEVAVLARRIPTSTRHRRQQFVKFPWTWVERLRAARHISTYRVALHLLHYNWRTGKRVITLSTIILEGEGVDRRAKWRALAELERVGLVQVERRDRKSPLVTLVV
jgi:hypothetical protein